MHGESTCLRAALRLVPAQMDRETAHAWVRKHPAFVIAGAAPRCPMSSADRYLVKFNSTLENPNPVGMENIAAASPLGLAMLEVGRMLLRRFAFCDLPAWYDGC